MAAIDISLIIFLKWLYLFNRCSFNKKIHYISGYICRTDRLLGGLTETKVVQQFLWLTEKIIFRKVWRIVVFDLKSPWNDLELLLSLTSVERHNMHFLPVVIDGLKRVIPEHLQSHIVYDQAQNKGILLICFLWGKQFCQFHCVLFPYKLHWVTPWQFQVYHIRHGKLLTQNLTDLKKPTKTLRAAYTLHNFY